jgi:hypothetical protein
MEHDQYLLNAKNELSFYQYYDFDGGPIMKRLPLIIEQHGLAVLKHFATFGGI